MGIAVAAYFVLCDDAQKARWLNEEEKGQSVSIVRFSLSRN